MKDNKDKLSVFTYPKNIATIFYPLIEKTNLERFYLSSITWASLFVLISFYFVFKKSEKLWALFSIICLFGALYSSVSCFVLDRSSDRMGAVIVDTEVLSDPNRNWWYRAFSLHGELL